TYAMLCLSAPVFVVTMIARTESPPIEPPITDKKPDKPLKQIKNYRLMSRKDRIKFVIRCLLCIICIFGLSFHASKLVSQYVWGQTIVNVKVDKIKYNKIPGVTICYPRFLSMRRLSKLNRELETDFIEYTNILKSVNDTDFANETLRQKILDIYWEKFMNSNIPYEVPVHDLFDNYTIPFRFPKRSLYQFEKYKDYVGIYDDYDTEYAIEIEAKGTVRVGSQKSIVRLRDYAPVESLAMSFRGDQYKCYTFFSELEEKWRKIRLNLNYIAIEIHNDYH
ncbi:unnamed protein product, partial [Oppiella nova]